MTLNEKEEITSFSLDSFFAKIINTGNSRGIIIPSNMLEVNGWDTNTTLKVWVKKVAQKKEEK